MSKIITSEFEELFERYPLGSQQDREEDSVVVARLHDEDFRKILLLLEYDSESREASCFVLKKDFVDQENLLTWYVGWINDPEIDDIVDISELEKEGRFQVDSSFAPMSLARYLKEKTGLLPVSDKNIVVLPDMELLESPDIAVMNRSERMRHVLRVQLDIPSSEPEYSSRKRLLLE